MAIVCNFLSTHSKKIHLWFDDVHVVDLNMNISSRLLNHRFNFTHEFKPYFLTLYQV